MDKETLARPYAKAAFSVALADKQFDKWQAFLSVAACALSHKKMQAFVADPRQSEKQVVNGLVEICGDFAFEQATNLLQLLIENQKLTMLPEISVLFETYRKDYEKTIVADVQTVLPLTQTQQQALIEKLEKRLSRQVTLNNIIDESLIGGMVVKAADLVIDRSVKEQLYRLEQDLMK